MTKSNEYELSFFEVLKLLKNKWKIICIVMLACLVLCGGYKIANGFGNAQEVQPYGDYKKDAELYEYLSEAEEDFPEYLKEIWGNISNDRMNNPIFSVNPYSCEYEQIVVCFGDDDSNHDWTVNNWIFNANDEELFGKQKDKLSDYKSSLILIGDSTQSTETAVQIIAVKGFDTKKASDYLIKTFKHNATEEGLSIENISTASVKGYNKYVEGYKQNNIDKYNSISYAYTNAKNMSSNISEPADPSIAKQSALMDVIKYCIFGLILGFILAVAYLVFDIIRKREIINAQQVKDICDLELLSDCSSGSEVSIDVLNANLDVMTEEHSTIAIVAEESIDDTCLIASEWTEKSDRMYIQCTDIFDNPESIEALKRARGIVIGIRIGKSKSDQIQRIIMRANKLNLNVLGFVLL